MFALAIISLCLLAIHGAILFHKVIEDATSYSSLFIPFFLVESLVVIPIIYISLTLGK